MDKFLPNGKHALLLSTILICIASLGYDFYLNLTMIESERLRDFLTEKNIKNNLYYVYLQKYKSDESGHFMCAWISEHKKI